MTNRQEKYKIAEKLFSSLIQRLELGKLIDKAEERYDMETKCYQDNPIYRNFKFRYLAFDLAVYGDLFLEKIIDDSEKTIHYSLISPHYMYRIETTKGKLLEFQQSNDGIDYQAVARCPVEMEDSNCHLNKAIRFSPSQIIHSRISISNNYPYGTSLLEKNYLFWSDSDAKNISDALIQALENLINDHVTETDKVSSLALEQTSTAWCNPSTKSKTCSLAIDFCSAEFAQILQSTGNNVNYLELASNLGAI